MRLLLGARWVCVSFGSRRLLRVRRPSVVQGWGGEWVGGCPIGYSCVDEWLLSSCLWFSLSVGLSSFGAVSASLSVCLSVWLAGWLALLI